MVNGVNERHDQLAFVAISPPSRCRAHLPRSATQSLLTGERHFFIFIRRLHRYSSNYATSNTIAGRSNWTLFVNFSLSAQRRCLYYGGALSKQERNKNELAKRCSIALSRGSCENFGFVTFALLKYCLLHNINQNLILAKTVICDCN